MIDTPGVRTDATAYAPLLARPALEALKRSGVIDGGMLPKVRAAELALDAGVPNVWIVDGRTPGNVLGALMAPAGGAAAGTRFVA